MSRADSTIAWACTEKGALYKWNFETGATISERSVPRHVQSIKVGAFSKTEDVVFVLARKGDAKKSAISYLRADQGQDAESITILTHDVPIRSLDVKEGGSVISAITLSGVLIGSPSQSSTGQKEREYTWREITCSEPPACFDIKVKAKGERNAGKSSGTGTSTPQRWTVDVVVGGIRGCIYVFQDALRRFEKTSRSGANITTASTSHEQQLHWHRESVGSVIWSLDGQYIVSGGKETVLVLWQLETGRKQFLPNLESPINSIGVSPSGSSYVVRLADNSVMVLSTSELSPTAHVAGVQAHSFTRSVTPAAYLPTVDLLHQFGAEATSNQAAAAINPRAPHHLLLSVPSNQDSFTVGGLLSPAPYLQDFDISTGQFVSRQALTRTNAINNKLGPEGNSIHEPNVKFLQTSDDGRWLATVDEWESPKQDVKHLGADGFDTPSTMESKLRFWLWNDEVKHWMLNSRIDEPHQPDSQATCLSVLALASDPVASRFATLGADSIVRFWTLKSKLKTGRVVRGEVPPDAKGKSRISDSWWAVASSVALEQAVASGTFQSARPDRGILAFSNDGSMLAAYQHYDTYEGTGPSFHFINTLSGTLLDSHNGLYEGADGIHGLAFLGQYLIILGCANAVVWDVTSFSLQAMLPLVSSEDSSKAIDKLVKSANMVQEPRPIPHLAVNVPTNTFAIAVPEPSRTNRKFDVHPLLKFKTRLIICSPETGAEPVFEAQLPRTTLALMSAGGIVGTFEDGGPDFLGQRKGYVILDLGAEVRTIMMNSAGSSSLPTPPPSDTEAVVVPGTLEQPIDVEDDDEGYAIADQAEKEGAMDVDEDYSMLPQKTEDARPVVHREQLAEVFDHTSLAMPSMQDLFKGVLNLYVEKPVQRSPEPEVRDLDGSGATEQKVVDNMAPDEDEDGESDSDSN